MYFQVCQNYITDILIMIYSGMTRNRAFIVTGAVIVTSTVILWRFLRQPHEASRLTNDSGLDCEKEASIHKQRYRRTVEICLSSIECVRNAIQAGANSIELCSDRNQGGVTPSVGLVEEAVRMCRGIDVEVHCLIRPRPGLFTYSDAEFDCILRDIIAFKKIGVTGT